MSRRIKTIEIPEAIKLTFSPFAEAIELYNDHISFGVGREVYFENYEKPCLTVTDFDGPVAKINLAKCENSDVNFDYEIHVCAKAKKYREEARTFAFNLYMDIQKEFYKIQS